MQYVKINHAGKEHVLRVAKVVDGKVFVRLRGALHAPKKWEPASGPAKQAAKRRTGEPEHSGTYVYALGRKRPDTAIGNADEATVEYLMENVPKPNKVKGEVIITSEKLKFRLEEKRLAALRRFEMEDAENENTPAAKPTGGVFFHHENYLK